MNFMLFNYTPVKALNLSKFEVLIAHKKYQNWFSCLHTYEMTSFNLVEVIKIFKIVHQLAKKYA